MSNRKFTRNRLKKIYKTKKKEDAAIGRRIEGLTKFWLDADKSYETVDDKVTINDGFREHIDSMLEKEVMEVRMVIFHENY